MKNWITYWFTVGVVFTLGFTAWAQVPSTPENGYGLPDEIVLPEPYATPSTRRVTHVVGWKENQTPDVPAGFTIKPFAKDLLHPRWVYILPNGDVLIAESNDKNSGRPSNSADRILLLRDKDDDGRAEERHVFIKELNQPFGMALMGNDLYVANSDKLLRFPYREGATKIKRDMGEIITELPAGGYNHHWTRNVMVDDSGEKLLVTVGSSSNVGEHGMDKEERRANILIMDVDGSNEEVYASGLRNPNGLAYHPQTGELWTAVNERDKLGNNLVPDYITSVEKGGFYGWPYIYYGDHIDPRWRDSMPKRLPGKSLKPDFATGSHTATMDVDFYTGNSFPEEYKNGAFAVQHGSWNRAKYSGYKVVFIPFENGKPTGEVSDFITGFLDQDNPDIAFGRPVSIAVRPDGSMLLTDDDGNTVWHIQVEK